MTLIKTSILSAVSTIIKIISGFIITKVIAVYAGPSGLALIGQLQNFINIILVLGGDFLKTAITKYTAEYSADEDKKYKLWSSSISIVIILNILMFTILFLFSDIVSEYLLRSTKYSYILKILAISLPFFVLNTMLLSILNGQRQIKKYIGLNISLSIVSLILVSILSVNYGLDGALVAYVINQSLVFFITLFFIRNEYWFKLKNFFYGSNYKDIKKLLGFAMITLTAILSSNFSLIYIRDFISETISLNSAGYWQGVWVLSQTSLMLITTSLATYFLPVISPLKIKHEISKELKKVIVFVLPIAILISLSVYLLRDIIVILLYTKEFLAMNELFLWQMIGNVIKVVGWVFGYLLVAKGMIKYTVSTEVIFALSFVGLSVYLIEEHGVIGVTYAYAINAMLHLITVFCIYRFKFKGNYE